MRKMGDMKKIIQQASLPGRGRGDTQRDKRQAAPFQAAIDFYRLDAHQSRREPAQSAAEGAESSPTKSTS